MYTAESISDDEIKQLRARLKKVKRQTSHTRAVRRDCDGALSGIRVCRESVAAFLNKEKGETK